MLASRDGLLQRYLQTSTKRGLHTWKKNLTTNTCRPAMATIIKLSITLKLKILFSVLLTVLKFRFSLVRKYFWFLVIVDSRLESLRIDSSSAVVCSGDVPCFAGIVARASFSTYKHPYQRLYMWYHQSILQSHTVISKSTYLSE